MVDFDRMAAQWDNDVKRERAKKLAEAVKAALPEHAALEILDNGCGTGLTTYYLHEAFRKICALDPSEEMRRIFLEKKSAYGAENVELLPADAAARPEYRERFDAVYSTLLFHHVKDIRTEILLEAGLLKRGGRLLIMDLDEEGGRFHKSIPNWDGHNGFARTPLCETLASCGFTDVSISTAYEGQWDSGDGPFDYSMFLCCGTKE